MKGTANPLYQAFEKLRLRPTCPAESRIARLSPRYLLIPPSAGLGLSHRRTPAKGGNDDRILVFQQPANGPLIEAATEPFSQAA